MAIETEEEVRARIQAIAPGATFTSGYRTPAHNARVGGVDGSLHTRKGEDGGSRGLDVTPGSSGLSMAQLNSRIANSGLNLQERLNEGDHVHVGFSGKPSSAATGANRALTPGEDGVSPEWLQAQGIDAGRFAADTVFAQQSMAELGYAARGGQWVLNDDIPPAPLNEAYVARQDERESLALDQEEAQIVQASLLPEPVVADIAKGVFLEGGQSVLSGVKRGVNETLDLVDEAADWMETYIPATLAWEGFDGDPETAARIFFTTQDKAEANIEAARDGARPSFLQSLGMGQNRLATSEGERPESVTGRLIEGVSQFATGFAGGGRLLRGWKTAARSGQIGKALVQGAVGDFASFDGNEARLSNLLAEVSPAAISPMFAYLSANEDDPELLGRFKNAVEGAALGGVTDLVFGGIRALRAGRQAKAEAQTAAKAEGLQEDPVITIDEAAVRGEELQSAVREAMGNPAGPRFQVKIDKAEATTKKAPGDLAATTARAEPTANVFDVNLARIETPDDVRAVITGMADRFRKDADLARRGTQTWEQTREAANGIDWVASMAERRSGQAINAEEIMAYRFALNSSASKVLELARKVEAEPTLANQFVFRKATAAHSAIQNEFFGARAEAGRALNAFRMPADAPATYLRQVDSLIADAGGANTAQELARKVMQAAENGDVALNEMLRGGALARTREIAKLVYTNSLLSGVGTPIINTVGNGMMLGLNLMSRSLSPRMARALGGKGTTQIGEASALVHGYQQALRDMFRLNPIEAAERIGDNAGQALREQGVFRGMAPGLDDAAPQGVKLRAEREEAGMTSGRPLSAGAWRVNEDSTLGRVMDIMQMIVEAPSNLNALTDDVFKTIAARGELHAQAFRRVTGEGLEGEAARARYADLMANPSDDMLAAAEREMHDLTFTRETPGIASDVASMRQNMDNADGALGAVPWGTAVFPFVRTPANLISVGMRYSPLAPFMRRWSDAMREGGAEAENAKAAMAVGTALWSVWIGMAMDGDVTGRGPMNRGQREAMQRVDENGGTIFQPYSVRVGDRWVSFERADPMGQGLALMGDLADLLKNGDWDSDRATELSEISAHVVASLGQAFFDKTMLRSATELTSALLDGTPADAERLFMQRGAGMIPGSSALRMTRRGEDPYMRETHNVVTALMNTVPGLSDDLPPQRDLWGRERTYQTGLGTLYDAITPVQTKAGGGSAIDLEILNNGVSVTMPGRSINVMGETISLKNRPDIYSEFLRLSGEPAFEHLNAVAEGTHPDSAFYYGLEGGPDGGRAEYIKDVVSAYRSDARAQILDQYASDLQSMAAERGRRRDEVRLDQ